MPGRFDSLPAIASRGFRGDHWTAVQGSRCGRIDPLLQRGTRGMVGLPVFAALFGTKAVPGVVQKLSERSKVPLFGVWIAGSATAAHQI